MFVFNNLISKRESKKNKLSAIIYHLSKEVVSDLYKIENDALKNMYLNRLQDIIQMANLLYHNSLITKYQLEDIVQLQRDFFLKTEQSCQWIEEVLADCDKKYVDRE